MSAFLEILVLDVGDAFRGYDCRDVVRVEEVGGEEAESAGPYRVCLGRLGRPREVRCRRVLGSIPLTAKSIRPVPEALRERMTGEKPWAVGVIDRGVCLLY